MPRIEPEESGFDPDAFGEDEAARALAAGVSLFNAGRYEEAHEEFEKGWLASEAGDSDFHKGLVQACICLHHLARGNAAGARKLYRGHRRLLAPFLPAHRGLDVAGLLEGMGRHLAPVLRAGPEECPEPEGPPPRLRAAE